MPAPLTGVSLPAPSSLCGTACIRLLCCHDFRGLLQNLYSQPLNAVCAVFFPPYRAGFPCNLSGLLRAAKELPLSGRKNSRPSGIPPDMNTGFFIRSTAGFAGKRASAGLRDRKSVV